jgi:hypothetical protein
MWVMLLKPINNKNKAEKMMRNEPSCIGDKPTKPLLIKINELPQISAKTVNNNHFKVDVCILRI